MKDSNFIWQRFVTRRLCKITARVSTDKISELMKPSSYLLPASSSKKKNKQVNGEREKRRIMQHAR